MSSSNTEKEVRLLGIKPDEMKIVLKNNNAQFLGKLNFKRIIFDTIPVQKEAWVRLRSDGKQTTLTYKKIINDSVDGTEEVEIMVDNLETTQELLEKCGLVSRNYQENTRELYTWMGCEIAIDLWPQLEPHMEIESDSVEKVQQCAEAFQGMYKDLTTKSIDELYRAKGIDVKTIASLKF